MSVGSDLVRGGSARHVMVIGVEKLSLFLDPTDRSTAFIFAAIMQVAGLDRRIALAMLRSFRARTVNGVIWAMFAVNMVLSLIIPAANARASYSDSGITFGLSLTWPSAQEAAVVQKRPPPQVAKCTNIC